MSATGRPTALDDDKQATVCSLVAAGVSLRQTAHFVDCDPRSIRREAQRDPEFRRRLAKARSEASVHPLQTLRQAAQADWRAALCWMERLDPERFARPNATVVTQREANRFVGDLIESIEQSVSNPQERVSLYEMLSTAMPAAMRRCWDGRRVRRQVEQSLRECNELKEAEEYRSRVEKEIRHTRRLNLLFELKEALPYDLYRKLCRNDDLLDPDEAFAQPPDPSVQRTCGPLEPHYDPTNCGQTIDGPAHCGPTEDG
jgi:hypothetical protein